MLFVKILVLVEIIAAYGNFEVGSRFLQVSEQETSEFVKNNRNKNTARKTEGNVKILYNWLTEV